MSTISDSPSNLKTRLARWFLTYIMLAVRRNLSECGFGSTLSRLTIVGMMQVGRAKAARDLTISEITSVTNSLLSNVDMELASLFLSVEWCPTSGRIHYQSTPWPTCFWRESSKKMRNSRWYPLWWDPNQRIHKWIEDPNRHEVIYLHARCMTHLRKEVSYRRWH